METNVQIIKELKEFLMQASGNKEKYCHSTEAFTRNRMLSFSVVVLFITNLMKRSLAIELDGLCEFLHKTTILTKGAFSQAGYKLKSDCRRSPFFQDWNHCLTAAFYRINAFRVKRWQGFRIFGIDGSKAYLPDHTLIREEFGMHANQSKQFPMAQMMAAAARFVMMC